MIAQQEQRRAQYRAAQQQFGGPDAEDQLAQLPQAPERQFEPDRKEQQDVAEFAEQRDIFARRDGDVPQPWIIGGERP